jgi:hypothetical protein
MKVRSGSYTALVFGLVLNALGHAQAPLSLDQEFSISHNAWYVSSLLQVEEGKVIACGGLVKRQMNW